MTVWRVLQRWWPKRDGQVWLRVRWGYWRESGRWPVPGHMFQWQGYLPDLWDFVRCAVWNRYDRLDIPTLSPTWNEWDEKLLHAAFAVFADYMTVDSPGRWTVAALREELAKIDCNAHTRAWCEGYLPVAIEMETLYQWWTVERAREREEEYQSLMTWHERLNRLVFSESVDADRLHAIHHAIEERNEAKDEDMLIRLMKIRRHLWT